MTTKDTNLKAQAHLGELLTNRSIDRLDEVFHTDVVDHDPMPDQKPGIEGIKQFWTGFLAAFPDLVIEPLAVSADDEFVTIVLDIRGTQQGEFLGHAPTARQIRVRGIQVGRFEDGKLVERWGSTDEAGLMKQLGLV